MNSKHQKLMLDFANRWAEVRPVLDAYLALRLPQFADAEDILQDIAMSAIKGIEGSNPKRPFLPWVLTLAKRRVADWYRSKKRQPLLLGETEDQIINRVKTHSRQQALMEGMLESCVEELNDKHRNIIELHYKGHAKPAQIAKALKTTPNTISVTLHRLRSHVKHRLLGNLLHARRDISITTLRFRKVVVLRHRRQTTQHALGPPGLA